MPAEPGPEFKAVPFACDSRPARCPECSTEVCQFGQTPGLRSFGVEPIADWERPHMRCPWCEWEITAPDVESAHAALGRHTATAHPLSPDEPPGAA